MNDKEIERAAIDEILNEAKLADDKCKISENGHGINKRLLSRNLVSTLRNPIFSRNSRKRRVIGLDDESDEADYDDDDTNRAKWKRTGDYNHLADDDYIYDAREYFNPEKYREIVANRYRKHHKRRRKTSEDCKNDSCYGDSYHGDSATHGKMSESQELDGYEGKGEQLKSPLTSSKKKKRKHRRVKDHSKTKKHRKKSKHKHRDDSVDKIINIKYEISKTKKHKHRDDSVDKITPDRHRKHRRHKRSRSRSDTKKKSIDKSSKKPKKSKPSVPSRYEQSDSASESPSGAGCSYFRSSVESCDRYDRRKFHSNSYYGNQKSDLLPSLKITIDGRIGDGRNGDRTEISYANDSSYSYEYSNSCSDFVDEESIASDGRDNYPYDREFSYNDDDKYSSKQISFEDDDDDGTEQLEEDSNVEHAPSSGADNVSYCLMSSGDELESRGSDSQL